MPRRLTSQFLAVILKRIGEYINPCSFPFLVKLIFEIVIFLFKGEDV